MYTYKAQLIKVVDGDTLDLMVDLGFNIHHKIRVRLLGVDCPETRTTDPEEKSRGLSAKQFTQEYVDKVMNDHGYLVVRTQYTDKYGRWLSEITSPDENIMSLTESLIANNHVSNK